MNAEKFEQVLKFSRGYTDALRSTPTALHDALECVICNSLLVSPYTLKCGHTFCSNCLALWFKERSHDASCPTCRDRVMSEPVPNLALRQLSLAVIESWNADPKREHVDIPEAETGLARGELLFSSVRQREPLYDNEDGVYRCPSCDHEIEDSGTCSGCGLHFPEFDRSSSDESFQSFQASRFTNRSSFRVSNRSQTSSGRYDEAFVASSSDDMDSEDMDFVVDDDDPEVYAGGSLDTHDSNSDEDVLEQADSSDDSDGLQVTDVRPSRRWASSRTVVIDDEDSG